MVVSSTMLNKKCHIKLWCIRVHEEYICCYLGANIVNILSEQTEAC